MKKRRKANSAPSRIAALFFGAGFSFVLLLLLSFVAAIILSTMKTPTKNLALVSLTVFLLCGFITGFVTSKKHKDEGLAYSLFVSLIFTFILLAISLVTSRGKVSGMLFMNYLCYIMINAFSAFFAKSMPKKRRRRT